MSNANWRAKCLAQLNAGSEVVDTSCGPIEFARSGSPPFVIQLHGTPGGYDQSIPLGTPFLEAGMGSISVSRPGYLRTPIDVGRTPAEQADALAALLDSLQIEHVARCVRWWAVSNTLCSASCRPHERIDPNLRGIRCLPYCDSCLE